MLTDIKLHNLKPKDKLYKVHDRDGLSLCGCDSSRLHLVPSGQITNCDAVSGRDGIIERKTG